MNNTAEVYLWGTKIGIIHQEPGSPFAHFEYDRDFLKSGIEVSPVKMPLKNVVYGFPDLSGEPFHGMPGLVADSLPDTFGNRIIEKWLTGMGKSISDFTAVDRLCYTGKRGMGALEYVPATDDVKNIDEAINVSEMVRFASEILSNREAVTLNVENNLTYAQLVQVGTSAGGARAKALIAWNEKTNEIKSGQLNLGKDFDYWLMKFDNVSENGDHGLKDEPEYTLIEYAYYKMASDCGINMNECRIYSSGKENHFMTKRFDRENGKKIHMQSLGALSHISYKEPCLCSYELAAAYMRKMKLSYDDFEQFYRRMVFNCIAVNQDDHVKNFSFLMNRDGEWKLAPAYDITFSYNLENKWLRAHQMTINGKSSNITNEDLLETGKTMGIKTGHCRDIIHDVSITVNQFEKYASEAGVSEKTVAVIKNILNKNMVRGDFQK